MTSPRTTPKIPSSSTPTMSRAVFSVAPATLIMKPMPWFDAISSASTTPTSARPDARRSPVRMYGIEHVVGALEPAPDQADQDAQNRRDQEAERKLEQADANVAPDAPLLDLDARRVQDARRRADERGPQPALADGELPQHQDRHEA